MADVRERLSALTPEQLKSLEAKLGRSLATKRAEPSRPEASVANGRRTRRPVSSSLFFFSAEEGQSALDKYGLVTRCAQFADAHDFEAVWVPERHFDPFGGPYPNPTVLTAALSSLTRRIGLRAGSVVLPLHDPIRVAEDWAMLDCLSRGRVSIALASGWHADDFALAPDVYADRKQALVGKYRELERLWRGEAVERRNGSGRTVQLRTYPRPTRAQIPVWITSSVNRATWETAAELGLNVLTGLLEQSVEELADKIAFYRAELARFGHDPATRRVTVMLHTLVGPTMDAVRATVKRPLTTYLRSHLKLYEKLARSKDLGVDPDRVSEADKEALVEFAFERYFTASGIFGTPTSCLAMVDRLAAAGVDEMAHLIDFGVDADVVYAHLPYLDELRRAVAAAAPREAASHTLEAP